MSEQRTLAIVIAVATSIALGFYAGQNALLMVLTFWVLQWRAARLRPGRGRTLDGVAQDAGDPFSAFQDVTLDDDGPRPEFAPITGFDWHLQSQPAPEQSDPTPDQPAATSPSPDPRPGADSAP